MRFTPAIVLAILGASTFAAPVADPKTVEKPQDSGDELLERAVEALEALKVNLKEKRQRTWYPPMKLQPCSNVGESWCSGTTEWTCGPTGKYWSGTC